MNSENVPGLPDDISFFVQGTCGEFDPLTCTATAEFGNGEGIFSIGLFGFEITGKLIATSITTNGCACDVSAAFRTIDVVVDPPGEDTPPIEIDEGDAGEPINLEGPLGNITIVLDNRFCDPSTGESVIQGMIISGVGTVENVNEGDSGTAILAESRVLTPNCSCPF